MEDSILKTTKRLLGGYVEGNPFNDEIIYSINSVLSVLTQLGVGPSDGFLITGEDETWSDFIGERTDIEMINMYVYTKVRLLFDPPNNSFLIDSMKKICDEFEWRLNVAIETPSSE
jgi:hypothetical protein